MHILCGATASVFLSPPYSETHNLASGRDCLGCKNRASINAVQTYTYIMHTK